MATNKNFVVKHGIDAPNGIITGSSFAGAGTGLTGSAASLSIGGTSANVTGVVAVANGGTGASNAATALTNLGAAPLANPAFTGVPTAPTAAGGTNTTQIATTAYVQNALTGVQGGAVASADKWTTARNLSLTGDGTATLASVDGSANVSAGLTLATVNANVGSFGSASSVSTFTVNAKGLITAASSSAIAIAASQVSSGTFADARIAASNVTQHQASLSIAESQIPDSGVLARLASNENVTGTWSFANVVTGVDPTNASHLATKQYVDNMSTGLDFKQSVRAATTANITLSGTQTVDGVALIAGDRILVKDQTTGAQNGIYVVAAGAWARSSDADNTPLGEVTSGMYCFVEEGTTNADSGWVLTNNGAITLGTTALTFAQFTGLGQITAGNGLTKTGSTLSVQTASAARIAVGAGGIDLATVTDSNTGTFEKVTVDAYGRVTGTVAVATADLTALLSSTYQPLDADLTSIAGLAGTTGLLRKTAANTFTLDTATYLTGNQSITLSGDATGSGTTAISMTLATVNSNVGSFGSATAVPVITVNAKGLVTAVSTAALGTMASQAASSVAITGGSINGTSIGASTAAAGRFTTVTATTDFSLNDIAILDSATASVTTTTATAVDSFAAATYRSVKYVAQIADGTSYEVVEFLIIHDGTTVHLTQYGNVYTSAQSLGSFDASIATGTLTVTFTAAAATTKTIKLVRTALAV